MKKTKRLEPESTLLSARGDALFLQAALSKLISHIAAGGGWDRDLLASMLVRSVALNDALESSLLKTTSKALVAQNAKAARAAAKRMIDDEAALAVLAEERKQKHGHLKRAAKRTGLSTRQLERLRDKKTTR